MYWEVKIIKISMCHQILEVEVSIFPICHNRYKYLMISSSQMAECQTGLNLIKLMDMKWHARSILKKLKSKRDLGAHHPRQGSMVLNIQACWQQVQQLWMTSIQIKNKVIKCESWIHNYLQNISLILRYLIR